MTGAQRIDLIEPVLWFGQPVSTIWLKSPKGQLFNRLGEPRFAVMAADKSQYWIEKDDVVSAYLSELLSRDGTAPLDGGDAIFAEMGLADVLQVRDALFGFFTAARATISVRNAMSSSSGSDASPLTPAGP